MAVFDQLRAKFARNICVARQCPLTVLHYANSIPAGLDSVSSTVYEVPMYSPHYVDVSADMHTCAISEYYTTLGMLLISSTDLRGSVGFGSAFASFRLFLSKPKEMCHDEIKSTYRISFTGF